MLRQGVPHFSHQILGVSDHHGVHPEPLLHHLLGAPVRQTEGAPLLHGVPDPGQGSRLPEARREQKDQEHHSERSAPEHGELHQGSRAGLPGGEGDPQLGHEDYKVQNEAAGGHLAVLHHPGGLQERAGDRLPGGPVLPVRLQRALRVRVRPLPVHQRRGVLRVQAHGEDGLPGLHVRRERLLRGAEPGRAQPPGLEENQDGRARRAGSAEVHLRDQEQGPAEDERAQLRTHAVQ